MVRIKSLWSMFLMFLSLVVLSGCGHGVSELVVTPKITNIPVGLDIQLKAEKVLVNGKVINVTDSKDVKWSSSDKFIASVDENGLVSTKNVIGIVEITATGIFKRKTYTDTVIVDVTEDGIESITITPQYDSVPIGLTRAFIATANLFSGRFVDVTNDSSTVWVSSDLDIAAISNDGEGKGVAEAKSIGSSTITASVETAGGSHNGSATLNVMEAIAVSLEILPQEHTIAVGLDEQFSAIIYMSDDEEIDITKNDSITWSSSDPKIATISNYPSSKGQVTGVDIGTVSIAVSGLINGEHIYGTARLDVMENVITSLEVKPKIQSVPVGLDRSFKVFAHLSDGQVVDATSDYEVSWSSSNTDLATISNSSSNKGNATGVSMGDATITAFVEVNNNEIVDTAKLSVTDAVPINLEVTPKPQLSADTPQIPLKSEKQFKAEVVMSDDERVDVTKDKNLSWISEDSSVATISNNLISKGLATGEGVGTTSITAKFLSNDYTLEDSVVLRITPAHSISFSVISEQYFNEVVGVDVEYLGYFKRTMGDYSIISGSEYLTSDMSEIYVSRFTSIFGENTKFFFGQSNYSPISGSLRYQATFKWPDDSTSEGVLEWDFYRMHYVLNDLAAVQNLIDNNWDFTLTVSNIM
ncbi:Ig-like domain-containing protein [Vibrio apostichopi]|uniref:Ig-like domain-containing protein n=1 Tax=Vibrio apostichopi TaxID=3035453 RepID=UPI0025727DF6|nr:Ig-like domain-containing protein [Vibrio sp. FE10]